MFLGLFLVPLLSLNRGMSNKRSDFSVVMLPSDTKAVVKFSRKASFSRAASAEVCHPGAPTLLNPAFANGLTPYK